MDSMEEFSTDQTTFAVLYCVLKRRAGLLYQAIYKSRSIFNIDSVALELSIRHPSERNLPRCLSTASQPFSAV
jgi:hypothetical protein